MRTGKKVAVIGSGPAGMAAAAQLNLVGHSVTVFERDDMPGGLLRYGIPDFKLEKWVIDRRIKLMEEEGIVFKCNANVGVDISISNLLREYQAVVMAGGSTIPRNLDIPGRELKGVYFAMQFLKQQNKRVSGTTFTEEEINRIIDYLMRMDLLNFIQYQSLTYKSLNEFSNIVKKFNSEDVKNDFLKVDNNSETSESSENHNISEKYSLNGDMFFIDNDPPLLNPEIIKLLNKSKNSNKIIDITV
jgi:hypothetical protein